MGSVSAVNNDLNQAILDQILLQQQLDALTQAQADLNTTSNSQAGSFSESLFNI